jgi:hypothetical protein
MVECELGCDEGSAFDSCFWYDDAIRERCDDLVADREHIRLCLGAYREYRDECSSSLEYRVKKPSILHRIVDIDTTSEYRYRIATAGECCLMRDRVDAIGSTAHDTTSRLHEVWYYVLEYFFPVARITSRPDDAEHLAFFMEVSSDVEEIGCLLDGAESLRIAL